MFSTPLRLEWICAQRECYSLPLTSVGAGAELVSEPVEILAGTSEFVHSFESYMQIIAHSRNTYCTGYLVISFLKGQASLTELTVRI